VLEAGEKNGRQQRMLYSKPRSADESLDALGTDRAGGSGALNGAPGVLSALRQNATDELPLAFRRTQPDQQAGDAPARSSVQSRSQIGDGLEPGSLQWNLHEGYIVELPGNNGCYDPLFYSLRRCTGELYQTVKQQISRSRADAVRST